MAVFGKTLSVLDKIINDISIFVHVITVIVSCIFLGVGAYNVIRNLGNIILLIIYAGLFAIALTTFILYLINYKKKKKNTKKIKKVLKYVKYVLRVALVSVNAYEILSVQPLTFNVETALLIWAAASLLTEFVSELTSFIISRYLALLKTAWEMDVEFFTTIGKMAEPQGFYELIDAPLESIANKIQNKQPPPPTKEERYVNELAKAYEKTRKEIKIKKKAEAKRKRKEKITHAKNKIKDHLKIIFSSLKGKPKQTDNNQKDNKN